MKTAILGWGSLLWDDRPQFDQHHGPWFLDGPRLRGEFSRISVRRDRALTLVLETEIGAECQVAYTVSHRSEVLEAVGDLKIREGATDQQVGLYYPNSDCDTDHQRQTVSAIRKWADASDFDAVIWTALPNNFQQFHCQGLPFSFDAVESHLKSLPEHGLGRAAEYVFQAPSFIETPLRTHLQQLPWFEESWHRYRHENY